MAWFAIKETKADLHHMSERERITKYHVGLHLLWKMSMVRGIRWTENHTSEPHLSLIFKHK